VKLFSRLFHVPLTSHWSTNNTGLSGSRLKVMLLPVMTLCGSYSG